MSEGPLRKWFREKREEWRRKFYSSPVRIKHVEVDAELDRMLEEKKEEWRRKGYSEKLILMATDLANEWAGAISGAFAPPELRTAIIRHIYPKALEVADHWITKFGAAK